MGAQPQPVDVPSLKRRVALTTCERSPVRVIQISVSEVPSSLTTKLGELKFSVVRAAAGPSKPMVGKRRGRLDEVVETSSTG